MGSLKIRMPRYLRVLPRPSGTAIRVGRVAITAPGVTPGAGSLRPDAAWRVFPGLRSVPPSFVRGMVPAPETTLTIPSVPFSRAMAAVLAASAAAALVYGGMLAMGSVPGTPEVHHGGMGWFSGLGLGSLFLDLFRSRPKTEPLAPLPQGRQTWGDAGQGRTVALAPSGAQDSRRSGDLFELVDQTRFSNSNSAQITLPLHGAPVEFTIGRSVDQPGNSVLGSELYLGDDKVSRHHAEIKWVPERRALYVRDLGSKNGISVDWQGRDASYRLSAGEKNVFSFEPPTDVVVIKAGHSTVTLYLGEEQRPDRPRLHVVPSPSARPTPVARPRPVVEPAPVAADPAQSLIDAVHAELRRQLGDPDHSGFQITDSAKSDGGAVVQWRRTEADDGRLAGDGVMVDLRTGTTPETAGIVAERMASLFSVLEGLGVRLSLTMVSPDEFGGRCSYLGITGNARERAASGGIVQVMMSRGGMGNTTSGLNVRANDNGHVINVAPTDASLLGEKLLIIDVVMQASQPGDASAMTFKMGQMTARIINAVRGAFNNDRRVASALRQIR